MAWGPQGGEHKRAGAGSTSHLVKQEGPHAWHPATVVHDCRNVTAKERCVRQTPRPPHSPTHTCAPRGDEGWEQEKQLPPLAERRRSREDRVSQARTAMHTSPRLWPGQPGHSR